MPNCCPPTYDWTAEVIGEEEVTMPMGTYNCYKVAMTRDDGYIKTEWWAVDGEFRTPIKYTDNCFYVGEEVWELESYTMP